MTHSPTCVPAAFAALDPASDTEPCDVCRSPPPLQPHLAVSLMSVMDAWICRCSVCGFRQVRPRLGNEEIQALYPDEYFDSAGQIGFGDYARQQQRYEREAFFLARKLARMAPQGRLLEVGCALGFLLDALRTHCGWETVGLDISTFAAHFARTTYGLDVRQATLEEAAFDDGSFDFILQKDLLEHVRDPRAHLLETRRILRPGGHVLLVTPNGEANLRPLARLSRELHAAGDEARVPLIDQGHLSYFSRRHLLRLLADSGLRPVRLRSIRVRRGLRALGWLPSRQRRSRAVAAGGVRFSRGSAAAITAERSDEPVLHMVESTTPADPPPSRDRSADGPENTPLAAGRRPGPPAAPAAGASRQAECALDRLTAQVASELESLRSPVRSWRPYFYLRQLSDRLDVLPAALPLGNDFEILARRV